MCKLDFKYFLFFEFDRCLLVVLGDTLITFETSAGIISVNSPSGRPKIPDIARAFDVNCENLFYLMRKINISWL